MPTKNFVGEKYGRLTVVSRLGGHAHCRCDCGNVSTPRMDKLRAGLTKSCGCLAEEMIEASRKPTLPKARPAKPTLTAAQRRERSCTKKLRAVWQAMRTRTTNPDSVDYAGYGGRGVTCCAEWASFATFLAWALPQYKPGLWLERANNELGYTPGNCAFATPSQQGNNRRNTRWIAGEFGPVPLGAFVRYHELDYMATYMRYRRLLDAGITPHQSHFVAAH